MPLQSYLQMIAQHIQKIEAPSKPLIKPLSHIDIQDDFHLENGSSFALTQSWNFKELDLEEMETQESNCTEEEIAPYSHKRTLNDLFSNSISKRCMMSKLERMDRAPTKRRHY